jgi:hypothetical protein
MIGRLGLSSQVVRIVPGSLAMMIDKFSGNVIKSSSFVVALSAFG